MMLMAGALTRDDEGGDHGVRDRVEIVAWGAREACAPLGCRRRRRLVVFIISACFSMIFRDFGLIFFKFWPGFRGKDLKKGTETF